MAGNLQKNLDIFFGRALSRWRLLEMLGGVTQSVELCDSTGRTLGVFMPRRTHHDYVGYESPLSPEEINRVRKEEGGRPLADILRDLERAS